MQLQTIVPVQKIIQPISYSSKIISLGSCFAVHISEKCRYYQFQNQVNPFGILFHPIAIEQLVYFAVHDKVFVPDDVFCYQEIWSCFHAHSDMNALSEPEILDRLNLQIQQFRLAIQEASHVIITLGTAWVYRLQASEEIVANCHKLPQKYFQKELLAVDDIHRSLESCFQMLQKINPSSQIIYTLSPVRHIKDGFVGNQQSKAHLISGLHSFLSAHSDSTYYFPSYEIMMDELRDYRFYGQDLLHPNALAIDCIWNRFVENCVTLESQEVMKKVEEVQKGMSHKPFNPYSEAHQRFLDSLAQKLDELLDQYPFMNFR